MQRWIVLVAALVILASGGAGFAYLNYRKNKPDRIWVPLKLQEKDLKPASEQIGTALRKPAVLMKIAKELNLAAKFKVASDEAAVAELSKRMFIEVAEANPPSDRTPALNIGVNGTRREHATLQEISARLTKEVFDLAGIKQPSQVAF
ncbi:hypothetical protein [Luteolibacter sp. LG18]|uniref:hypothetical protein n=1 Tax=Luteolibacter sp. LG18 TaxID=2819286 RepID=UPI002B30C302|nr:hypothetical protein llg_08190 [Luteolibacter sp. LG18]